MKWFCLFRQVFTCTWNLLARRKNLNSDPHPKACFTNDISSIKCEISTLMVASRLDASSSINPGLDGDPIKMASTTIIKEKYGRV
jgi:hypothetical protein